MLQAEFEGYHEPNSITRMTAEESAHGNGLDGRFRKGTFCGLVAIPIGLTSKLTKITNNFIQT
jgi:hypothetical protein